MTAYLVQIDLPRLSERLSRWLGCRVTVGEVRELLRNAGFVESAGGWLTRDVRPCLLAYVRPGATLF